MSVEANKQVIHRFYEAFNAHDLKRFLTYLAEALIFRHPSIPDPQHGIATFHPGGAGYKWMIGNWTACPDLRYDIERIFGEANWVCTEGVVFATHTAPLSLPDGRTLPATNNRLQIPVCGVYTIEEGKIVEWNVYYDLAALWKQFGLA